MQVLSTPFEPSDHPPIIRPLFPDGLVLPFPHGKCFIPASHIVALSSERNYTRFHFHDGSTLLYSRTLREMLTRLSTHSFDRIHRSHAVNRQHICTISENCVELTDGSAWAVSRRKRGKSKG